MSHSLQGLGQIVKLKGAENYEAWYKSTRAIARLNGVWELFTGQTVKPTPPAKPTVPVDDPKYGPKYEDRQDLYEQKLDKYNTKYGRTLGLLKMTLEEAPKDQLGELILESSKEQMDFLKQKYEVTGYTAVYQALGKIWKNRTAKDYSTPIEFANKIKKAKT
ncbi:MAG: hypothetical protein FRX48_04038 [Lasallia pustulata]|uniref:Uncharacterized protein n=1 Tax=Lasallia pustulata TaxID=136370 RepID=A0A5M8PSG3_9LECA|nr:MAG: hypothetical protein FRX48_04038 [Lasallia pustulata]